MKRSIRILAGKFAPSSIGTRNIPELRPTQEKIRKSFYEIIQDNLKNRVFCDVFAGTGIMGFEALSRGCHSAVFFERNSLAVQLLSKNAASLLIRNECRVISGDAMIQFPRYLKHSIQPITAYIDPPYNSTYLEQLLKKIGTLCREKDIELICEHHHKLVIQETYGDIIQHRQKRYGETMLTFFRQRRG